MEDRAMELHKAILKRRSVRRFTEDVVTDEELPQIFEAVRRTPLTGMNGDIQETSPFCTAFLLPAIS
jgi:nitroreductase